MMAAHLSCRGTPLCARPSGRLGAGVRPFAPLRSKVACRVTGENPFGGPSTSSSNGASTAQQQPKPEPAASDAAVAESRLELLEASVRGKKAAIEKAKRAIPIKGMVNKQQDQGPSNYANWPEGQLFPDGWDNMPLGQKITEIYLGKRGILYWSTQAAWFSALGLIGGWLLFRGGALLGFYQLAGDSGPPPPF